MLKYEKIKCHIFVSVCKYLKNYKSFQTNLNQRIHSLKYPRSTKLSCKEIVIIKSKFVAKTQFNRSNFLIIFSYLPLFLIYYYRAVRECDKFSFDGFGLGAGYIGPGARNKKNPSLNLNPRT